MLASAALLGLPATGANAEACPQQAVAGAQVNRSEPSSSTDDLVIRLKDFGITTANKPSVLANHKGNGDIDIEVRNGILNTSGQFSYGIHGYHQNVGAVRISVQGGCTTTVGDYSHGIYARHSTDNGTGTGDIDISVVDHVINTTGTRSHGVHSSQEGFGSTRISFKGGSITTTGESSAGI